MNNSNSNSNGHHILNSKSEYNRCALPRLTAKLGAETLESLQKLQKQRIEEKKKEAELMVKIRAIKIKKGIARREQPGRAEQPAEKKRKIAEGDYKRVLLLQRF